MQDSGEIEVIKNFYDTVYYKDVTGVPEPSRHQRNLVRKLGIDANSRVLDVACGSGAFLAACREVGANTAGVDLSETAIEACRASFGDADFHAGPAESLPFEDARFDIVTCLGSLEHFSDPLAALREMQRVATRDAIFVLLVPNSGFLTRRLGLYSGTYQADVREVVRSLDEWKNLFEDSGLRVHQRWKDLHVLSWEWIRSSGAAAIPLRAVQALALPCWPLSWQYQVYHLARQR